MRSRAPSRRVVHTVHGLATQPGPPSGRLSSAQPFSDAASRRPAPSWAAVVRAQCSTIKRDICRGHLRAVSYRYRSQKFMQKVSFVSDRGVAIIRLDARRWFGVSPGGKHLKPVLEDGAVTASWNRMQAAQSARAPRPAVAAQGRPARGDGVVAPGSTPAAALASAAFSTRIRHASRAALRMEKVRAIRQAPKASGRSAISAQTTA
jgi:hypothetical protein